MSDSGAARMPGGLDEELAATVPRGYRARALQYLVLRHVWELVRSRKLESGAVRDVARSLSVEARPGGFELRWRAGFETHVHWIERGDFVLFAAGDSSARPPPPSWATSLNERRAREIAHRVLGLEPSNPEREPRLTPRAVVGAMRGLLLPAAVVAGAGTSGIALAALLFAWNVMDAVPRAGALLSTLPLATLAYAGAAHAAALGGAVYGLFQALDPDPRMRVARSVLLAAVVGFAAWLAPDWGPPSLPLGQALGIAVTSLLALVVRWTMGTHDRTLPVVLPMLAIGLAWDGLEREALGVLGYSLASSIALAVQARVVRALRVRKLRRDGVR